MMRKQKADLERGGEQERGKGGEGPKEGMERWIQSECMKSECVKYLRETVRIKPYRVQ